MVSAIFSRFSCFGFSGSRSPSGVLPPAALSTAAAAVPGGSRVVVGCARGVDAFFRQCFPDAEVFAVSSGRWGKSRGAFAARSVACVKAVASAGGLWVSFPASPCPTGLVPSASSTRCFSGSGSGTWSSLAFALGLGVPCLVFSHAGVPSGWGLAPLPGSAGWFGSASAVFPASSPVQLSLF